MEKFCSILSCLYWVVFYLFFLVHPYLATCISPVHTRLPVFVCYLTVYMDGFIIAAANLPGNIFTILVMDSTGGKALLCEFFFLSQINMFSCLNTLPYTLHIIIGVKKKDHSRANPGEPFHFTVTHRNCGHSKWCSRNSPWSEWSYTAKIIDILLDVI